MTPPRLSFEFFPPQSLDASFRLWDTVQTLAPLDPGFVSVTYGAGGTTRDLTHDAVTTIHRRYGLNVAAHLTCVEATRAETLAIADRYAADGVTEIVALRGDPPKGQGAFTPHPDGFADSCELIAALAETGKFHIRVGAYPDPHPEATRDGADVDWLKRKLDAGADSAITQYFYNVDAYKFFVDSCEKMGIDIPIVVGIMPITNYENLMRFSNTCGAEIPRWIRVRLESYQGDMESIRQFGEEVVTGLCEEVLKMGAPGLHFYTLNQLEPSLSIWKNLNI